MNIKNYKNCICYLSLFFVFLILLSNSIWGKGPYDEGMYMSIINRFCNGDSFYIDDWSGYQAYAPIFMPFVNLYKLLVGSTDGIILYGRIITIFLHFFTSLFCFYVLSKTQNRISAFFSSILLFLFCKSNIFGFSYYTYSFLFLSIGLLLFYWNIKIKSNWPFLFISGIFIALSSLFNLYVISLYFFYGITLLFIPSLKDFRVKLFICYFGILFIALFYAVFILEKLSIPDLKLFIGYLTNSNADSNSPSIKRTIRYFVNILSEYRFYIFPMTFILIIFKLLLKNIKTDIFLVILNSILFVINIGLRVTHQPGACYVAIALYALFIIFIYGVSCVKNYIAEILCFFIPGFLLSLAFRWASDQRMYAIAIGYTIVNFCAIYIISKKLCNNSCKLLYFCFIFSFSVLTLYTFYLRTNFSKSKENISFHLFSTASILENNNLEIIDKGPYRGIYTTKERKNELHLQQEIIDYLNNSTKQYETVLFIRQLPWSYVAVSNLQAKCPDMWRTRFTDTRIISYFENRGYPNYIIVLNIDKINDEVDIYNDSDFDELLQKKYKKIKTFSAGDIFYLLNDTDV